VAIVIALNKVDLIDENALPNLSSPSQWQDYPQAIATYTTSAKSGVNVDEIFQVLARALMVER
jgi:50S ribosomal subunit-associated GTPase HflX